MWILLGLGNPGATYSETRHNLGLMLVDRLLRRARAALPPGGGACREVKVRLFGSELLLAVPTTFMNLSGSAAALLMRRHSIAPSDLLLAYDDLDLPLGQLRVRARGSDGGHKGVRSVLEALGSEEVARIRMGIRPQAPIGDPAEFVLDRFAAPELTAVDAMLERAVDAVRMILREGLRQAMNVINTPLDRPAGDA
ncbi:MAG TPA: aminoacyl-tRNA hydrolase [Acidobacteriota bacterium]